MRITNKILFILLVLFISLTTVQAASNNKLVIALDRRSHSLTYDTDQFDKNSFLNYRNMQPGEEYEEKLQINNTTRDSFQLFIRIRPNLYTLEELELLDNIIISIYRENELVYTGTALGLDYQYKLRTYQEIIPLGMFNNNSKEELTFITYLKKDYDNKSGNTLGLVIWDFYTISSTYNGIEEQYYDENMNIINPNTKDYVQRYAVISIIAFVLTLLLIISYSKRRQETKN